MLWLIGIAFAVLVFGSLGQVTWRRLRATSSAESSTLPVAKWLAWLLGVGVVLVLLRFGLHWLVVVGTALLGLRRWAVPLFRLLPIARFVSKFVARWVATKKAKLSSPAVGPANRVGKMSRREALKVLGLEQGATADEVAEAYKNLIVKMHPDRGGSSYLASQINEARDVLL